MDYYMKHYKTKSAIVKKMAKKLGLPYMNINFKSSLSEVELTYSHNNWPGEHCKHPGHLYGKKLDGITQARDNVFVIGLDGDQCHNCYRDGNTFYFQPVHIQNAWRMVKVKKVHGNVLDLRIK